jgi:hypothetical protein
MQEDEEAEKAKKAEEAEEAEERAKEKAIAIYMLEHCPFTPLQSHLLFCLSPLFPSPQLRSRLSSTASSWWTTERRIKSSLSVPTAIDLQPQTYSLYQDNTHNTHIPIFI